MKCLLFDFDGVIIDSFDDAYETMSLFQEDFVDKEAYRRFFDGNIYESEDVKEVMDELNDDDTLDENDPFFKEYIPRILALQPVKGMSKVLEELAEDHKMSVVSSTISSPIKQYLKDYKLADYFDNVYGGDVHKSKVKKIAMVLEEYACKPEESLFITDTLGDLREAEHAGIRSIGVTWGFHSRKNLEKGANIAVVDTPEELLEVIKQHS